jgi:DNA polymerase
VTYHPAYLLRNPADKAKAWDDLLLAARAFEGGAAGGGTPRAAVAAGPVDDPGP